MVAGIRKHDLDTHCLEGKFRQVVLLAQVAEEYPFQMIVQNRAQELAAAGIGQVAPLTQDALLKAIGIFSDLKHIDIMV